jgi:putative mycofactocin binding protein MftB
VRGLLNRATTPFDPARAYRLHSKVALRPEPFGALAYHYGNRRLNFLRAPELVTLVEGLGEQPSVDAALAASGIEPRRWPSFRSALAALLASDFLEEVNPCPA